MNYKAKKFFLGLLCAVIVAAISIVLINSIIANIHDVSMLQEWKNFGADMAKFGRLVGKFFKNMGNGIATFFKKIFKK